MWWAAGVRSGRSSKTVGAAGFQVCRLIERQPTQMAVPLLEWFCKESENSWSLNMSVLKGNGRLKQADARRHIFKE